MNKIVRIILIGILFLLLILVRAFAPQLFYDPLTEYFKNDYLHKAIPEFDIFKLFSNLFLRYLLNTLISIGIIYLFYKSKRYLTFSVLFYSVAFLILSLLLYIILNTDFTSSHLPLFYTRRFLIHPIFVLILLPAFYYQNKTET